MPISNLVVAILSGPINIQPLTDSFHKKSKKRTLGEPKVRYL